MIERFFFKKRFCMRKKRKKHKKHQKALKEPKTPKNTKKHQKTQKRNQVKAQNANKQIKIKNALKKYLSGK